MIDVKIFDTAMKLSWIRRLYHSKELKWINLSSAKWPTYHNFTILGFDFVKQNLAKLNRFWKDVFQGLKPCYK